MLTGTHFFAVINKKKEALKHPAFAVTGIMIAATIFLFGCATAIQHISLPSDLNTPPTTMARIFVIRNKCLASHPAPIACNKTTIGNVASDSYICWDQPPGMMSIGCQYHGEYAALKKQVKPGITYFFLIESYKLDFKGTKWFAEIDDAVGNLMVSNMKPPQVINPTNPPTPDPVSSQSEDNAPEHQNEPMDAPATPATTGNMIKL